MKRLFLNLLSLAMFLMLSLFTFNANAQEDSLIYETNDTIFDPVEIYAEFPGGEDSLMMFVYSNLVYPTQALKEKIEGRVVCDFVVEKDGSISDIKILRSFGYGCDEEAVRIVKLMPKWIPGKLKGEVVRVKFTLPIKFKLNKTQNN
jgi:protein TonB